MKLFLCLLKILIYLWQNLPISTGESSQDKELCCLKIGYHKTVIMGLCSTKVYLTKCLSVVFNDGPVLTSVSWPLSCNLHNGKPPVILHRMMIYFAIYVTAAM